MEVDTGGFQVAVFEVVEVEHHARLVERRLRIAHGEIESSASLKLHAGQQTDGLAEQFFFRVAVVAASLTSGFDGVEERRGTKVGLQIAHLIGTDGQHLRHGKTFGCKVAGQGDKGMVLLAASAHAAYHGVAVGRGQAVVDAVAACAGQFIHTGSRCPTPLAI